MNPNSSTSLAASIQIAKDCARISKELIEYVEQVIMNKRDGNTVLLTPLKYNFQFNIGQ